MDDRFIIIINIIIFIIIIGCTYVTLYKIIYPSHQGQIYPKTFIDYFVSEVKINVHFRL